MFSTQVFPRIELQKACLVFSFFLKIVKYWEKEERGEKHRFVVPLVLSLSLVCTLTRGLNHNAGVSGWCSNQLNYQVRAACFPFIFAPRSWVSSFQKGDVSIQQKKYQSKSKGQCDIIGSQALKSEKYKQNLAMPLTRLWQFLCTSIPLSTKCSNSYPHRDVVRSQNVCYSTNLQKTSFITWWKQLSHEPLTQSFLRILSA